MTKVERVRQAIAHRTPDKVPKGEWYIAPALVAALLGREGPVRLEDEAAARELLGMDLVALPAVDEEKEARSFRWWRENTDLFIFGVVDGPFQRTGRKLGFLEFLSRIVKREEGVCQLAQEETEKGIREALRCLEAGAHGIILADDVAYARGLYLNPSLLKELFVPLWERQVAKVRALGFPVFFHSDGNIHEVLPWLVEAGFSGVHSLEPTSGMDIREVKAEYGSHLCLMGNFEPGLLYGSAEEEIERAVKELMAVAAAGGGFIFSTSSGYLGPELPPERVLALYRAADRYGQY